ncbi:hypothetical protein BG015_009450 [Linnemannia schmuckeri]|uniref:Uncharacterized protein n=1 Tax=Linnemannia schmuckeri TaxID=64567 RepID=A0A9P5RZ02_9FUNG|nr:hypothetical protein BG015_009450 [Linnemannia schmuckeri]
MQPALYNVRSNLAQLPRSISPHLSPSSSSSSASSSIRSLSPSRHSSPHLRSRSASPSPRRFASVLAYHAILPSGGYGKQRSISADQQLQGQESERGSREHNRDSVTRESRERQESPSQIAVRNLEESWKRFELDSGPSSPSLLSSSPTFVDSSPLSPRPSSPSPLSKPPYRELIECTFFKDTKVLAPAAENESEPRGGGVKTSAAGDDGGGGGTAATGGGKSAVLKSESSNKTNNNTHDADHQIDNGRRRTTNTAATTATPSTTTEATAPVAAAPAASSTLLSSSSPAPISSSSANKGTAAVTATPSDNSILIQQQQHHQEQVQNAFLASNEVRHILDLPSLLGQEPDRISQVLAMPIPLQPKPRSSRSSSLASIGNSKSSTSTTHNNNNDEDDDNTSGSALISKLNAKAESTAEAMTKRYAAKNLNMTETEAHRMVQVMAAEIVALHEERAVMVKKMELAKQEMLEAARLLRMKAAEAEAPEELQGMSAEGQLRPSPASGSDGGVRLSVHDETRAEKETESSEEERQRSMYDRDEWRERD